LKTMHTDTVLKGMLRFMTVGSVDDGKSTLIGRLLYDSQGLYEDQLLKLVHDSRKKDQSGIDFSLITDGLKAEREQGITIDVAYRYFSTPKRKFIIADTPGHEFYTRNMVTAASVSDVSVLLVDARKGLLPQTCRHSYIASLLGIRRIIVAINKMDLVDYQAAVFDGIRDQYLKFASNLGFTHIEFVPVSAREGDNVVLPSTNMSWYDGPTLLSVLEDIPVEHGNEAEFRFPVQLVIRPNQDFRGYAGQIVSGKLQKGQTVVALPSNQSTRVEQILVDSREVKEAFAPMSIMVTLRDHIELGRGDMLVIPEQMPVVSTRLRATLIWMSSRPLKLEAPYLLKHTTQTVCGSVVRLQHQVDTQTLFQSSADTLELNDIGEVEIETHKPVFVDRYAFAHRTGSFVLIDPVEGDTLAAGIVLNATPHRAGASALDAAHFRNQSLTPGLTVWFTGLSGAGKTTIARAVYVELLALGIRVEMLDGDVIRKHLNSDLRFTRRDRDENVRRIGFLAHLLTRNGVVALVSAISPYRAIRDEVRATISSDFMEVFVNAPLEVCQQRDPKGLYQKVREKKLSGFTGVDDPYEHPLSPEIECRTDLENLAESTGKVVLRILEQLRFPKQRPPVESFIGNSAACD